MKLEQIKEIAADRDSGVQHFFDKSYSKVYGELLNIEVDAQVKFLLNNYLTGPSSINYQILDLCCGTGRHLQKLSDLGYSLDGVDINPEAVAAARDKLINGRIYLDDVQYFCPNKKYDLIYCMESSIGYLPDFKTIDIFSIISKELLSDQGVFVLHLTNREYLLREMGRRMWFGNSKSGYVLEDRSLDLKEGLLTINQIRIIDGVSKKYSVDLRLYSLRELKLMLREGGLTVRKVYGDYNNNTYDVHSPYLLVECIKSE